MKSGPSLSLCAILVGTEVSNCDPAALPIVRLYRKIAVCRRKEDYDVAYS